jgi:hypothetical protein
MVPEIALLQRLRVEGIMVECGLPGEAEGVKSLPLTIQRKTTTHRKNREKRNKAIYTAYTDWGYKLQEI